MAFWNAGHLLTLSVPGVEHSQFYRRAGTGHLRNPKATPGHLTHVFESAMDKFIGKDEVFDKQWLVRQGLEKLVHAFKGMFSQF